MSGIVTVLWRVRPVTPPRPIRHCATCGAVRAFWSSGKVRLNANGRLLDAWLIYKCETCARTWNRPLVERTPISAIASDDVQAMQASAPDWVVDREFDQAGLARHARHLATKSAIEVMRVGSPLPQEWDQVELAIEATIPVAQRVDRFLASALGLSRTHLRLMGAAGGLVMHDPTRLKRPLVGGIRLQFKAAGMTEAVRARLTAALANPLDEIPP
jgi:hypothetical protein